MPNKVELRERVAKMLWEFHYQGKIYKWESLEPRESNSSSGRIPHYSESNNSMWIDSNFCGH